MTTNSFYNPTGAPVTAAAGLSATMRAEFTAIASGFALLPTLAGNANKVVVVNSGASALTAVSASTLSVATAVSLSGGSVNATSIAGDSLVLGGDANIGGLLSLVGNAVAFLTPTSAPAGPGFKVYVDVADGKLKAKSAGGTVTILAAA